MLTLLFVAVVCGLAAWVVYSSDIPTFFKNCIIAILVLIVVVYFFQIVLHVNTNLPMR